MGIGISDGVITVGSDNEDERLQPHKVHHVVVVSEMVIIAYLDTRGDVNGRPDSPIDDVGPIELLVDEQDFEHLNIGKCVHLVDPYLGESEPFYVLHTNGDTFTVQRMVAPLSEDGRAAFSRNESDGAVTGE